MSELSRDQILAVAHPLGDAIIAEIIATGVTLAQFKQACAFYAKDRKLHRHGELPGAGVGKVVSLLERANATVHDSVLGEAGSTLA